jgi:hypothetical protein
MNIVLPDYVTNYNLCPIKDENTANKYGFTFKQAYLRPVNNDYVLYWGLQPFFPNYGAKYGVMETGFFSQASFIDTIGNYQYSSLNTRAAYENIENFDLNGRPSAKDIILNLNVKFQSKYNPILSERNVPENWDKIILTLQNPKDRSILSVTSVSNYYKFVEECCKFYGKNLFVKMHPWNSNEIYITLANIAKKYNCSYGKACMNIIKNSEFVISFNSTIAVDCLLRDVPYVQYGIGTFYNSYGIHYSKNTFPTWLPEKKENGQKLCDFLIHKYCFRKDMNVKKFANLIKHFSVSNEIFPMTDDYSYATLTRDFIS